MGMFWDMLRFRHSLLGWGALDADSVGFRDRYWHVCVECARSRHERKSETPKASLVQHYFLFFAKIAVASLRNFAAASSTEIFL
jgi:hypothetical protein